MGAKLTQQNEITATTTTLSYTSLGITSPEVYIDTQAAKLMIELTNNNYTNTWLNNYLLERNNTSTNKEKKNNNITPINQYLWALLKTYENYDFKQMKINNEQLTPGKDIVYNVIHLTDKHVLKIMDRRKMVKMIDTAIVRVDTKVKKYDDYIPKTYEDLYKMNVHNNQYLYPQTKMYKKHKYLSTMTHTKLTYMSQFMHDMVNDKRTTTYYVTNEFFLTEKILRDTSMHFLKYDRVWAIINQIRNGMFSNKIPTDEATREYRRCKRCQEVDETNTTEADLYHLLISCSNYDKQRSLAFRAAKQVLINHKSMPSIDDTKDQIMKMRMHTLLMKKALIMKYNINHEETIAMQLINQPYDNKSVMIKRVIYSSYDIDKLSNAKRFYQKDKFLNYKKSLSNKVGTCEFLLDDDYIDLYNADKQLRKLIIERDLIEAKDINTFLRKETEVSKNLNCILSPNGTHIQQTLTLLYLAYLVRYILEADYIPIME